MVKELANSIELQLLNCTCPNKMGPCPFFFKMKPTKKVMLISHAPSFQAVYRHLPSTRFFRSLCLALYGPYPEIDVFDSIVNRDIYWTHYHKCYVPKSERNNISSLCSKKYLKRELEALLPNLIIILGEPVVKRLLGENVQNGEIRVGDYMDIPYVACNFPAIGNEPEFVDVRRKLAEIINGIDVSPVPQTMVTRVAKTRGTAAVHAYFELQGLREYLRQINEVQWVGEYENVDDMWYKTHLIPRWLKYSFVIASYSFIEDQLHPLLVEAGVKYDRRTTVAERLRRLAREVQPGIFLDRELSNQLDSLRDIRNTLVHSDGRLEPGKSIRKIPGIYTYLNVVEITPEGCEEVFRIVERFVRFIVRLDRW